MFKCIAVGVCISLLENADLSECVCVKSKDEWG